VTSVDVVPGVVPAVDLRAGLFGVH
jgi:hypothetical protein